jgi:hypothetical protein
MCETATPASFYLLTDVFSIDFCPYLDAYSCQFEYPFVRWYYEVQSTTETTTTTMTAAAVTATTTTTASATTATTAAATEIHYNVSTQKTVDGIKCQWCLYILCC